MKKLITFSLAISVSIGANAISSDTDITASRAITEHMISALGNGMVFENQKLQIASKPPKYTQQHIYCMTHSSNDFAIQAMQRLLEKNFDQNELKQMNTFFNSPSGKKYNQVANNRLTPILTSKNVPTIKISLQEQQQIDTFWQSATGNKLGLLLKNKPKLSPTVEEIVDKKQIDCNLPKSTT